MLLEMKKRNDQGVLITFCGLDGCGKTSVIQLLNEKLLKQNKLVLVTKQPTDAMRNTEIFRTYMDSEEHNKFDYRSLSLMAAADRIQHVKQVIMPALLENKCVISDRYFYSCLANLRARGYQSEEWIYEIARHIPRPDYAFFLDLPVDLAVSRVRMRAEERDRYIDMDLQYKLREEYLKICKESGGLLIASNREITETFAEICDYLKNEGIGVNERT